MGEGTIQASSDFFDLGGHSLLLAKLSAALLKDMGAVVPIPAIIERPTLAELAELLDEEMTSTTASTCRGEALGGGGGGPASVILPTPALRYNDTLWAGRACGKLRSRQADGDTLYSLARPIVGLRKLCRAKLSFFLRSF